MIKERSRIIENKDSQRQSKKASSIPLGKTDRATTWEEVAQESAGNRYMERIQEEIYNLINNE